MGAQPPTICQLPRGTPFQNIFLLHLLNGVMLFMIRETPYFGGRATRSLASHSGSIRKRVWLARLRGRMDRVIAAAKT